MIWSAYVVVESMPIGMKIQVPMDLQVPITRLVIKKQSASNLAQQVACSTCYTKNLFDSSCQLCEAALKANKIVEVFLHTA